MTDYYPVQILEELEQAIVGQDFTATVAPLPGDKWLASSSMQKAVRQGKTETALRAALNLWTQDKHGFWRRAHTISVEDVGVASPEVIVKVLTAYASTAWRRRVGDLRIGLYLIKLMCEAVKTRLADQAFTIVDRAGEYRGLRNTLSKADDNNLAGYVLDDTLPLQQRLLSLWLLAGTTKYPSEHLPQRHGSPEIAADVLRDLDTPADMTEACISVMTRTQWPLVLFTPVLFQEVKNQPRPLYIWFDPIPALPDVEGIPLYGADQYTRVGKACLREFQKAIPALRSFNAKQLGIALFYIEGEKTDKTMTGTALEEYRKAGELADAESTGLCVPAYLGLRECMIENLPILHDIRQRQLRRYLEGGAE